METQAVVKDRRADTQFAFVIDRHIFITDRIGRRLVIIAVQPDGNIADRPRTESRTRQAGFCHDTKCHFTGVHDRIRLVSDELGTKIIEPVVTQQRGDTLPLGFQIRYVEVIPITEQAVAYGILYQRIHLMTHPDITDTVIGVRLVHLHLVN